MNRTLEEATVKRHRPESRDQLRKHLGDFVAAYNVARRLNTLKGLTPYERTLARPLLNLPAHVRRAGVPFIVDPRQEEAAPNRPACGQASYVMIGADRRR